MDIKRILIVHTCNEALHVSRSVVCCRHRASNKRVYHIVYENTHIYISTCTFVAYYVYLVKFTRVALITFSVVTPYHTALTG